MATGVVAVAVDAVLPASSSKLLLRKSKVCLVLDMRERDMYKRGSCLFSDSVKT